MPEGAGDSEQTFLFADLAGYTALTEAHGDEVAAEAAADFYAAVRRLLPDYDGHEVKRIGDAVMLRVPDAAAAIEFAARLIGEVGARHGALGVRVGAHSGSAVEREGDWYGAAVNLAARVAEAAERGEVLMTDATRAAAGDALERFRLEPRPRQAFKNIAEPVSLYGLTLSARAEDADLPVDPVCRMAVDPARSSERRSFDSREFHFCSEVCAEIFDRHPERYATPESESG